MGEFDLDLAQTWGNHVAVGGAPGTMGSLFSNQGTGGRAGGSFGGGPVAAPIPNANVDAAATKALSQATANYQQQFQARYNKLMSLAQQFGAGQQQQNADLLRQQSAQGQNSLVSRGLGNSTVVNAVQQNAQNQAAERNAQAANQVTQMQTQATADIQPQAPNYSMYANLLSQPHTGSYAGLINATNQPFNVFGGSNAGFQPGPAANPGAIMGKKK